MNSKKSDKILHCMFTIPGTILVNKKFIISLELHATSFI